MNNNIKKEELMRGLTDSQVSESKSKYGTNELAKKATTQDLKAGDTVTVKGTSTKATNSDPATMNTIKDVVKQLKATDEVTIGTKT